MRCFATVLLVDARGWLLLQERDEHAPIDPDVWGLVGGHVEEGEGFDVAVRRELAEETGLRVGPGELTPEVAYWRTFSVHDSGDEMAVYYGRTDATDGDVVCGEGRQIVFVSPDRARALPLAQAARLVVPQFLDASAYATLWS
ncbi:NUDIX domain-containing protein [Nocardioides sp.]|uniref:NUDIX domain-containing protein n=1 Tax=Nocardioides sp. TaxID=35761 RepID=UPI00356522CE